MLHFPRDDDCNVVYCNIEGIAFINDRMIAAGSLGCLPFSYLLPPSLAFLEM